MFLLLAFSAWLFFLLPGPPQPAALPGPTTITGHLTNAPAGDTVRLWYGGQMAKAPVNAQGDFRLLIGALPKPSPASFAYARQRGFLYLTPGDQLQLTADFSRFDESLRYTGQGADVNNYLAQSLWKFESGKAEPRPETVRNATTTAAQMRHLADDFRQKRLNYLTAYQAKHPLPAAFIRQERLDFDLERARQLLDYPGYVHYATQREAKLPSDYYQFLRALPHQQLNEQADREPVLRFLSAYGGRLLPNRPLRATPDEAPKLYAQATADLGKGKARDWAMFQLLAFQLNDNVAAVASAYPTFKAQNRDSTLGRNLRQLLHDKLQLQPGAPAPAFTLRNQEGRAVSLSDFKGKVVYLDFWGTWCAPCRQEMPALQALARRFAGRDVVFISIAVRDSRAKWQQVVDAERLAALGQVQLHSPDGRVADAYQVAQFPSYLLLDRQGHIRQANAPRPSAIAQVTAALEHELQPQP